MKKKKISRFPDYSRIDTGDIVTFGTSVYIKRDRTGFLILFPTGSILKFEHETYHKIIL